MAKTITPMADWHWPVFEETLCGTMTDRERLGLPDCYVPGRLDAQIQAAYKSLRCLDVDALLGILKTNYNSLAERIVAGNLLALIGDPRINLKHPEMVEIKGGEITIGLDPSKIDEVMEKFSGLGLNRMWIEKESPSFKVDLKPFKLAKYPVTNQEFKEFLLSTNCNEIPTSWDFRRYPIERSNHPVYTVTHKAADQFVKWLAKTTGRAFRLPTEAEWEWAAMGPGSFEFPWGDTFNVDLANTCETGIFSTTSVGVFVGGESPFGLCDMAGNVEEYVSDFYLPYPNGKLIQDHLVDIHGEYRIARGGGFSRFRDLLRTKRRHGHNPKSSTYAMGFRLAESI